MPTPHMRMTPGETARRKPARTKKTMHGRMHGSRTRRMTRKRMRRTTETPAGNPTFESAGFRASTIPGIARNVGHTQEVVLCGCNCRRNHQPSLSKRGDRANAAGKSASGKQDDSHCKAAPETADRRV